MTRRHRAVAWRVGVGGVTLLLGWCLVDPGVVLLLSRGGADWVRADRPFDLRSRVNAATAAAFETTFVVPAHFPGATLRVTGLRRVGVDVDGRRVLDPGDAGDWKRERAVPLPADLSAGVHRLRLTVTDAVGPPLVRARCQPLGIATGRSAWRTADGRPAVAASLPWRPALSDQYGSTATVAAGRVPLLLAVLGGATVLAGRWRPRIDVGRWVRWAVLAAWVALGAADVFRLPLGYGYDAPFHYDYIRFVADHARLPRPDGGVQFFQAPLYYVVSAVLWRALAAAGVATPQLPYWMRLVPLACGAGLAEACYRTARHAFPGRPGLHAVAVVVGGLMPVNLYMGLAASNEPLAGLLGGMVALVGVRFLTRPAERDEPRRWVVAGVLLGLAVLTKLTAGLWAVPLAVAVRRPRGVGWILAVAAIVSGPWFVRTWVVTGNPIVSHTILANAAWWQDPGYRTPRQLLTFGRGLTRVAYGGVDSVWDSLYSTAWGNGFLGGTVTAAGRSPVHLDLMAAGLWLGLGPMGLILVGLVRTKPVLWDAEGPNRGTSDPALTSCLALARLAVALFLAAVVWVYLTLPIYSCAKASYLLSTLPCVAVLAAAGWDRVVVGRWPRAVAVGLLTCWAAASYLAYVVIG